MILSVIFRCLSPCDEECCRSLPSSGLSESAGPEIWRITYQDLQFDPVFYLSWVAAIYLQSCDLVVSCKYHYDVLALRTDL